MTPRQVKSMTITLRMDDGEVIKLIDRSVKVNKAQWTLNQHIVRYDTWGGPYIEHTGEFDLNLTVFGRYKRPKVLNVKPKVKKRKR